LMAAMTVALWVVLSGSAMDGPSVDSWVDRTVARMAGRTGEMKAAAMVAKTVVCSVAQKVELKVAATADAMVVTRAEMRVATRAASTAERRAVSKVRQLAGLTVVCRKRLYKVEWVVPNKRL
jgi:hypothetical protein